MEQFISATTPRVACAILLALTGPSALAQQTSTFQFQYDAGGNLTQIVDPLGRITTQSWDSLNRLSQQLQPAPQNGAARPTISYVYDGQSRLASVTDPRNLVTTYTLDGLGNLVAQSSPDTGSVSKTYDEAGNLKTSTDAKGQTTSYQYDVLNRVTQINYAVGNLVTFSYDQGVNGIGHLTSISDNTGSTQYSYDQHGRVLSEVRIINGTSFTTGYSYDNAGRLASVTYPSGRQLVYQRDTLGRIAQIDSNKDGVTQNIVSQVTYYPFGDVASFVNGAGQLVSRSRDLDGRINSYTIANHTYTIGYDDAGRIRTLAELGNSSNSQSYGYDGLDRLSNYSGTGASQTISYDPTGNRTSKLLGTSAANYVTATSSNRLSQITGSQNLTYQTDSNGSIVDNGNTQFGYDARGRVISVTTSAGGVQYGINALGQRVSKTVQGKTTVMHYDSGGKLIGESTGQGSGWTDYVYLNDVPVALFK